MRHRDPESTFGDEFADFLSTLAFSIQSRPELIRQTLSNVFSMRVFGNKTHGDLAEVALTEFINKYVEGYSATHVGKEQFRSKQAEEDIAVETPSGSRLLISLKAYGIGPLQLSTNKDSSMFTLLQETFGDSDSQDRGKIQTVLASEAFDEFHKIGVIPLIYDERQKKFNILIFDSVLAYSSVQTLTFLTSGRGRKHPVYRFLGPEDQYIFEVRYGGAGANALQRGLWTHTLNAHPYFKSLTNGWMKYYINRTLLAMFSHALVSTEEQHARALEVFQ